MSRHRVVYKNWLAEIGFDATLTQFPEISLEALVAKGRDIVRPQLSKSDMERGELVSQAVRESLRRLSEDEQELVARYHFMGETYTQIAEQSGRSIWKLISLHERALKKLRNYLQNFVEQTFGAKVTLTPECQICQSPSRLKIDALIRGRDKRKTWRTLLKLLNASYGLVIKTPQVLISHEKYHLK